MEPDVLFEFVDADHSIWRNRSRKSNRVRESESDKVLNDFVNAIHDLFDCGLVLVHQLHVFSVRSVCRRTISDLHEEP
jgi:hypothetical protein